MWGGSKKLCENDVKGGRGCSALDIMGDCQGKFAGNHWMTSEGEKERCFRVIPFVH